MNNTTFPFYTSTAQQDANRLNTAYVRICPRERLLPFQIERSHLAGVGVDSIKLVDCSGNKTSLGTGYFSSIGTSISDDSSLGTKEFTSVDYIQYAGGTLETPLPYGVYYLELEDTYGIYYSEHFSVRDLNKNTSTWWTGYDYNTFTTSGLNITSAINTSTGSETALSNTFTHTPKLGDVFTFYGDLTLNSGELPTIEIVDGVPATMSNSVQLAAGFNKVVLTTTVAAVYGRLQISNTTATNFSISNVFLRRNYGDYVKVEFENTTDLIHSGTESIMYATGGFNQVVYLDTRFNIPSHEPVEVGSELDGVFIAEQLNSTYLYSVVDYVSRSLYNGMQYLPLHDSITITDEVGNEYSPGVGNIDVVMDWNTFDTGSLRLEFNDGSMTWVNDHENIT